MAAARRRAWRKQGWAVGSLREDRSWNHGPGRGHEETQGRRTGPSQRIPQAATAPHPHTLLVRPLGGLPETETIWGTQTTGPTRLR